MSSVYDITLGIVLNTTSNTVTNNLVSISVTANSNVNTSSSYSFTDPPLYETCFNNGAGNNQPVYSNAMFYANEIMMQFSTVAFNFSNFEYYGGTACCLNPAFNLNSIYDYNTGPFQVNTNIDTSPILGWTLLIGLNCNYSNVESYSATTLSSLPTFLESCSNLNPSCIINIYLPNYTNGMVNLNPIGFGLGLMQTSSSPQNFTYHIYSSTGTSLYSSLYGGTYIMASPDSNGYFTNVIQLGYWPQKYQQNYYTTNPLTYQPNPLLTWSGLSENPPNSNSSSDYPLTPYPTSLNNNNTGTQYGCCYDIWISGNYYYMQWGNVGEEAIGLANSLFVNNAVSCCCAVLENKDPKNCQNPSSHTQFCNTDCCSVIAESLITTNSYNDSTTYVACQNYQANSSS